MLNSFFELEARGTTINRELRGAITTFLTMAYILFANPEILGAAGVPKDSATACTAAAAGICCILMGIVANFPIAMASGMGLNAFVAFQIARQPGWNWQMAMALIVVEGLIVLLLVLVGAREAIMNAIPRDLRRAIGAGIGLFIAFIGAVSAKIVVVPSDTIAVLKDDPAKVLPPVTHGNLANPETAVAVIVLAVTAYLLARRVQGAIVLGILVGTIIAVTVGISKLPGDLQPPTFSTFGQFDLLGALRKPQAIGLILGLLLVDFFDTIGTVTAIAGQAGLHDHKGQIPRLRQILVVDSMAASIGGLFGISSVTSYIESAAGVAEGARTGLHSVFVGLMFLGAIFFAPLAGIVPAAATAPALILVGFLMTSEMARIDYGNLETAIPSFIILVILPFTYSITHGIGYGFIAFVAIKALRLKFREVHPLMYVVAALFLGYFLTEGRLGQ